MILPAVYLEPPTMDRADEFIAAARRSRRLHHPWLHAPDTPERYEDFVGRSNGSTRRSYLVCRRDDDALAGTVNVSEITRGARQNASIGYCVFVPWNGQGLMEAGLRLVLDQCFGPLRLHRVEASIQPDNTRSTALIARIGFRREGFSPRYLKIGGRWRDHEHWALLREEWRSARD